MRRPRVVQRIPAFEVSMASRPMVKPQDRFLEYVLCTALVGPPRARVSAHLQLSRRLHPVAAAIGARDRTAPGGNRHTADRKSHQAVSLRLSNVWPVRIVIHRNGLPDELREADAQWSMRRRPSGWHLRGKSGGTLRLDRSNQWRQTNRLEHEGPRFGAPCVAPSRPCPHWRIIVDQSHQR